MRQEYGARLREAQNELGLSPGGRVVRAATWFIVGEAIGWTLGVPAVGGALAAVTSYGVDEVREKFGRSNWLLADHALHRMQARGH